MTSAASKTTPKEAIDYFGPLNVEVETQGYTVLPPLVQWIDAERQGSSTDVIRRAFAGSAPELGTLPLRAFISGMYVYSGASASLQPSRLVGLVMGQIHTGDFTITGIDADDLSMTDRMREITSARALVESRLDALSSLLPGWLDGRGVPPTTAAVSAARHLIWILLNHRVERPRLAPTPEGGVEAEWSHAHREVSVTFEPDGSLYGNAVDVTTGEISEPGLRPDDHQAVADFVLGA